MEIPLHKFIKFSICFFLFYIICFKHIIGERSILLYGSTICAAGFMIADMIITGNENTHSFCPYGVLLNIIMCVYSIATGFFSARNINLLLQLSKTYLAFSAVCIVVCYISMVENNIDWLAKTLIIINIISSLYVIMRGYYRYGYGYVLGATQNPNNLGLNLDIAIFCLAYESRGKGKKAIWYFFIAALFIYVIIGCGSRKALIAAGIMCVLWMYPYLVEEWRKGNSNKRFILTTASLILVFGVFYYFSHRYAMTESYQRMQRLGDESQNSSSERVIFYRNAIEYFAERPLFGIGFGQFSVWNSMHEYAHSTYAEALANWGLVGCVMYFTPVLMALKRLLSMPLDEKNGFIPRVVLGLWIMEIFLGIGQIWFYSMEHILVWTIIYLYIKMYYKVDVETRSVSKYVKA